MFAIYCIFISYALLSLAVYNTLNYQELGLTCPEDLFDIEFFNDDPKPFFKFAHSLYPGTITPSPSHNFLAWLDKQGILLRVYTQNIDALEEGAGVSKDRVVYSHGSLSNATCMKCKTTYSASDIVDDINAGRVPLCKLPTNKKSKLTSSSSATKKSEEDMEQPPQRVQRLRRSSSTISTSQPLQKGSCNGIIKPNVTFFGEKISNDVSRQLQKDYLKADALIVMGTSLSVAPMSRVVDYLKSDIPRILVNRNIVRVKKTSNKNKEEGDCLFDACLLGNCDDVLTALTQRMKGTESQIQPPRLVMRDEPWLHNQPKESVLLFPGAADVATTCLDEPVEVQHKLIVHCDECQNQIVGKIYSCTSCFDYDLCDACYISKRTNHADGKHVFAIEEAERTS